MLCSTTKFDESAQGWPDQTRQPLARFRERFNFGVMVRAVKRLVARRAV